MLSTPHRETEIAWSLRTLKWRLHDPYRHKTRNERQCIGQHLQVRKRKQYVPGQFLKYPFYSSVDY